MKKVIALFLALVMAASLIACGQKPADSGTPELKDKYTIGFSKMYGTDIYISCIGDGLEAEAKVWEEKLGVEIEIVTVDSC